MKRSVRLLSMLAATLLLLAACSSADETGGAATEGGGAEVSEPAVTSEVVSEPALTSEPTSADTGSTTGSTDRSILDVAEENPQLSQLVQALEAAGLTDALNRAGPITVFAPNNDAFSKLDQSDLTALLTNPSDLGDILQYHVVEGSHPSSELTDGETLTTLNGQDLTVSVNGSDIMVNDATVVQADIQAGNGVIHIVDTVLQP